MSEIDFPRGFGNTRIDLHRYDLGPAGNAATQELRDQGYYVKIGLQAGRPTFFSLTDELSSITRAANSEPIREFCPNDIESRFKDTSTASQWLRDGKAVFQLRDLANNTLAGYGWTGPKASPEVPGGDTTFALRITPEYTGKHLASNFTKAIVAGSLATFGKRDIWLETWASNTAAVKTYLKSGAQLVTTADSERPTLKPAQNENSKRRDVRLFMSFITSKYLGQD